MGVSLSMSGWANIQLSDTAHVLMAYAGFKAKRHRVLRVHHLVAAAGRIMKERGGYLEGNLMSLPPAWVALAEQQIALDADAPRKLVELSDAVRQAFESTAATTNPSRELTADRLLSAALCCWRHEHPAGPGVTGGEISV